MKKQIDVVGAVILDQGHVLCVQRGPHGSLAGKWEFPGGKIEPGEDARAALIREIREELECEIAVGDEVTTTSHEYEFGIVNLTTYYCRLVTGTPTLVEHADQAWVEPNALHSLDWAAADIPAVALIQRHLIKS